LVPQIVPASQTISPARSFERQPILTRRGYKAFGAKMASKNMMNHYQRAAQGPKFNHLKYLG
jgi:hypothetical protein